ncbi:adenosylcobinamide amidohydrolase [Actinomadura sp. NBRC 104425]|uniref:adenosylcobinamide amidohydrolase n=1 Tax=Actinomadura sp. NBRC 104425 TaxID=3032204 RepID=UPI0024A0A497|nr:adenosylcobinamide amidohydrolase [Actinomadura sp. NBRC 104425]GLZ11413.1 adenosylcobinamide amidohydrolase [Actinomadura sp. NBRC 104425]
MRLQTHWREEDGARLAATVWRTGPGLRAISSALLGGGIGPVGWVLNAQVPGGYARLDPQAHLSELADAYGLRGRGVAMMTAAPVDRTVQAEDEGVAVSATVGLRVPTWAAAPPGAADPHMAPARLDGTAPGTINIVVAVPVPLGDAALVNAVVTATEAKTQALLEAGWSCTGTASDAICVAAPVVPESGGEEPFAGPRSTWGARIARAVHAAVRAGAVDYAARLRERA